MTRIWFYDFRDKKQIGGDRIRVSNRDSGIDSTCELHMDDVMM